MVFGFSETSIATDENPYLLGKKLLVRDSIFNERRKLEFTTTNVLCITSEDENKSKKIYKLIFKENGVTEIACFIYNANTSMKQLCSDIDHLNSRLVQVSKKAIVNVKYFELSQNSEYKLKYPIRSTDAKPPKIWFSKQFGHADFDLIKDRYKSQLSLPERLNAYRRELNQVLSR